MSGSEAAASPLRIGSKKEERTMNTKKIALIAGVAVVIAGGLLLAFKMGQSTSTTDVAGTIAAPTAQTTEINPFTHVASIPAIADPSTIRFEKLKTVEIASKTKTTTDAARCKELQSRDPDGSSCQTTTVLERVKAVEASYSYNGLELSAGENVPGRDTFSVYFRPEEVVVDGPVEKLKRDQAAAMFLVTTYRPMVEQKVVDKQHSHYCDGNYMDGNWVRTDPKCEDQVQFITQTAPSPNFTVQVDVRTVAAR
jgi:hypothetical protein